MIHIEQLKECVYLIRGGKYFKTFGDPYQFSLVFILEDSGKVAYIKSLCKNGVDHFDRYEYMKVNDVLRLMGIEKMKFERYRNGKIRYVTLEVV